MCLPLGLVNNHLAFQPPLLHWVTGRSWQPTLASSSVNNRSPGAPLQSQGKAPESPQMDPCHKMTSPRKSAGSTKSIPQRREWTGQQLHVLRRAEGHHGDQKVGTVLRGEGDPKVGITLICWDLALL